MSARRGQPEQGPPRVAILAGAVVVLLGALAAFLLLRQLDQGRLAGERAPTAPEAAGDREQPALAEEEGGLIPPRRLDLPPQPQLVVPWEQAHLHLGKVIAAEGLVVRTHNSGRACFLNFAEDWQGRFHGVIFAASFEDYPQPPEELFRGRRVRLIGKVTEHQGAPQIVIERPEQIELLDG